MYILPKSDCYQVLYHSQVKLMITKDIDKKLGVQMISYLKYQANMAVSEHRRPQIGAMKFSYTNGTVNLRLSTVGDFRGMESLVIRFIYPLESVQHHQLISGQTKELDSLVKKRGLVLFAGPMGSGKTTTMYQLARRVMGDQVVMSIEDPVEIEEEGFIQLQVNTQASMAYDQLLKVGLRHRPDTFIVGEIRDQQTAKMAIQAALSGHLVLSTVHAQNAFGVVSRMEQLGIERHYLSQTLSGVCYQRLIPTTDDNVAVLYDILQHDRLDIAISDQTMRSSKMTSKWGSYLEKSVANQKITRKTALAFEQG